MHRFVAEYRMFKSCSVQMRALLIANSIYAFVLPVIEIFVAAYVLRSSHHPSWVVLYQLSIYIATPLAFAINGYLLRRFAVNHLYAAGMILSGGALLILMSAHIQTETGLVLSGGLMGLATGIFWANRGYLALSVTDDESRNYFYGIETCVITATSVAVPLIVGSVIEKMASLTGPSRGAALGYTAIATASLALTIASSMVVLFPTYRNPPEEKFIYFRFTRLWYRLIAFAALRGLGQAYIITAPALLIMRFVGEEGTIGRIEAIGSCCASLCLYGIGRVTKQEHRIWVFGAGLVFFLAGSIVNAILFNATGVLVFMACLLLAKPLIDLAYYPIQLWVVDVVSHCEGKSPYSYVVNHEFGLLAGRLCGCTLFLVVSEVYSNVAALRYVLLTVVMLQMPSIFIARGLVHPVTERKDSLAGA